MLKPLTMWITTNWKILKEMEIPDHITCLLKNLYVGQEITEPDIEPVWTWLVQNRERLKAKGEGDGRRWLDSITDSMNMNLSKPWAIAKDRGVCLADVFGVVKNQTRLSDWTTTIANRMHLPWKQTVHSSVRWLKLMPTSPPLEISCTAFLPKWEIESKELYISFKLYFYSVHYAMVFAVKCIQSKYDPW